MIALAAFMRNHGYDPDIDHHTRIPGIWSKLGTMYNLDLIDEQENSQFDEEERFLDFELPFEDFGRDQFMRGKRSGSPSENASSPARLNRSPTPPRKRTRRETITNRNRASTVEDTDEPKTSPPNSPSSKLTRRGRGTTRTSGRTKAESSSRAPSKDTAMEDEEAEEAEETEEAVEEDDEDEDDGDGTASERPRRRGKTDAPTIRKSKRKR
jgi:hypothetical protein